MTTHAWHPYNSIPAKPTPLAVSRAQGHYLHLADATQLLDGIASWWTAIFGYNHPALVEAIGQQSQRLSHVMFGGLTHPAAEQLAEQLAQRLPHNSAIFFSDSGSVAVEIALKMARQYWHALGLTNKKRFLALRNGYHGDTWAAMSVSDPDSLHQLFRDASEHTFFVPTPNYGFGQTEGDSAALLALETCIAQNHHNIAAFILEPIWQGAGAMNFYSPSYLQGVRQLCNHYQVLLICDEIATGFGKTGAYFAHQHANIRADIVCLGKALTGGMMTLAATCASQAIADSISQHSPHRFMHGPTYMANALACACASASLQLLDEIDWLAKVTTWQQEMTTAFLSLTEVEGVTEVRVLGHVAVVELDSASLAAATQARAVAAGIWIRPFGRWAYLTPAYTMTSEERQQLLSSFVEVIRQTCQAQDTAPSEVV
ncbi:MAG: adenosylmethionine--8-amino-7-oxononanoate transaminase [Gammaproteobacteria bacterium]|nr:adenosylmethionine--8-amino-7-oxononanoate transaminase [Gammaproteobacteria bacterium]